MTRRCWSFLLIMALVLGFSVGALDTASALGPEEDTRIEFPWVPNGAMLGDSGPYYGTITIQNLEDEQIVLWALPFAQYTVTDSPHLDVEPVFVDAFGSTTLTPEQVGLSPEFDGTAINVEAWLVSDNTVPARIAGVQKQVAPVPSAGNAQTGPAHLTAAGYSGVSLPWRHTWLVDTPHEHVLPIVQTNSDWNTVIRVANYERSTATNAIRVTLHEAGGFSDPIQFEEVLERGEIGTFDLLDLGVPTEWVGSAVITADTIIGAVAERFNAETNMLMLNTSRSVVDHDDTMTTGHAQLILREWNHWNTGISIANLADAENEVAVTYYASDGTPVDSDEVTIPPTGMNFIFTPSLPGSDAEGFVGAAVIEADFPFLGAVDQVKYLGDQLDSGHAMSYMIDALEERHEDADLNRYLVMPLVQKGDPDTGMGDTSGIQLFNPSDDSSANVNIWILSTQGDVIPGSPLEITLGPREGYTAYSMAYEFLPPGFQGTAIIQVIGTRVVAVSNVVNYEAQFDGSASFNLPSYITLSSPAAMAVHASPNPVSHPDTDSTLTVSLTNVFGMSVDQGTFVDFESFHASRALLATPTQGTFSDGTLTDVKSIPTDANGQVSVVVRRTAELGSQPIAATIWIGVAGSDLEEEIEITWLPEPRFAQLDYGSDDR